MNEKCKDFKNIEVYEGIKINGSGYDVHPKLEALELFGVPAIHHVNNGKSHVESGSSECITYVDNNFGEKN